MTVTSQAAWARTLYRRDCTIWNPCTIYHRGHQIAEWWKRLLMTAVQRATLKSEMHISINFDDRRMTRDDDITSHHISLMTAERLNWCVQKDSHWTDHTWKLNDDPWSVVINSDTSSPDHWKKRPFCRHACSIKHTVGHLWRPQSFVYYSVPTKFHLTKTYQSFKPNN